MLVVEECLHVLWKDEPKHEASEEVNHAAIETILQRLARIIIATVSLHNSRRDDAMEDKVYDIRCRKDERSV